MNRARSPRRFALSSLISAAAVVLVASVATAEPAFAPGFHGNGIDGIVQCGLVDGDDLYVGGTFAAAGDVPARCVARWDGHLWHALGAGLLGDVYDLVMFEGDLMACGSFLQTGDGVAVNQVARWDGQTWQPLGDGISSYPGTSQHALAVYDDYLWCSGHAWDGQTWWEVLIPNGNIWDLAVHDDHLVAAGSFSTVNGHAHHNVVGYANGGLVALPGQDFEVTDLEVHAGQLHALRHWDNVHDPAPVSVWTGSGWDDVGDIGEVNDTDYVRLLSHGGVLHLMGVDRAPGAWSTKIATWSGSQWNWVLGAVGYGGVLGYMIEGHPDGIVLGGILGACGATAATGLVLLVDGAVVALGPPGLGISGRDQQPVWTLASTPDGVVVGGTFEAAGSVITGAAALFDGGAWHARDLGDVPCSLVVWHGGQLHAFPRAGEGGYPQHAIWNGVGWDIYDVGQEIWATTAASTSGSRLLTTGTHIYDWSIPDQPQRLETLDGGIGWSLITWDDRLVVGGTFNGVGGVAAARLAVLQDGVWSCPGGGMNGEVRALTVYGGRLIAGGTFTTAGGVPANRIAAWSGSAWEPIGAGFNTTVEALIVYQGDLYAGGTFTTTGGAPLSRLARWTGDEWVSFGGGGADRAVDHFAVYDDKLYLAGHFSTVGDGLAACRFAVWDGEVFTGVPATTHDCAISLSAPVPNPFNPSTTVGFTLEREAHVRLDVYDVRGRLVATLVDRALSAGEHAVTWSGRDDVGRRVSAGRYLLRLEAAGDVRTAKVVLVE